MRGFAFKFGGAAALVLLFASIIVVTILVNIKNGDVEDEYREELGSEVNNYQYFQYNPKSKESSTGFISLPFQQLKEDEYISYQRENSNYVLISNFGTNEYQCTGSCTCEQENSRKSSSVALGISRGLVYLVAAMTSISAIEKAKEYFNNECESQLYKEGIDCAESSMRAEVKDCGQPTTILRKKGTFEKIIVEGTPGDIQRYMCRGNCLSKKFKKTEEKKLADNFKCEFLKVKQLMKFDCLYQHAAVCRRLAEVKFLDEHLSPLCKTKSKKEVRVIGRDGIKSWKTINLCYASVTYSKRVGSKNKSVKCKWTK